jgi:hypothetical protein
MGKPYSREWTRRLVVGLGSGPGRSWLGVVKGKRTVLAVDCIDSAVFDLALPDFISDAGQQAAGRRLLVALIICMVGVGLDGSLTDGSRVSHGR